MQVVSIYPEGRKISLGASAPLFKVEITVDEDETVADYYICRMRDIPPASLSSYHDTLRVTGAYLEDPLFEITPQEACLKEGFITLKGRADTLFRVISSIREASRASLEELNGYLPVSASKGTGSASEEEGMGGESAFAPRGAR